MKSGPSSSQALSFPGEEGREAWVCEGDGIWKRVEDCPNEGVMGLGALSFDSAPFWSVRHGSIEDAVALRWESLGLSGVEGAQLWTQWLVRERGEQVLVGTLALTSEPSNDGGDEGGFERFEPSARMLPLPRYGLAVWKELGRYVAAFAVEGNLVHSAVLTSRKLDADAAFEVRDLCAALQAHGFLGAPEEIRVWTLCETDFVPQLACLFEEADIKKEARPAPFVPGAPSGLLPGRVAVMRLRSQQRKHRILILAAAALAYVLFFGAWWLRIEWRKHGLNQAEAEMAVAQPQVDLVREAQQRWMEMEAAINPDLYPMELFHQVASLLPAEGIRLKEFQIEGGTLVISGEATSVNHALGFKDRLAACVPLQRYAWNFPVPSIREDNRAEFRAEGTLVGGLAHESE